MSAVGEKAQRPKGAGGQGTATAGSTERLRTATSGNRGRRAAHRRQRIPSGLLPQPPDDREKYSYAKSHVWVLTCCSLVSFSCLALSQYRLTQVSPWLWAYMPFLAFAIMHYLLSVRVNGLSSGFSVRDHRSLVRSWRPATYPTVDVFLAVCGEPIEVLHNTWAHVHRLRQRYPGIVTPYVLDDSNKPEFAAMAVDFGFVYCSRPNRGWFKKAGNLDYGYRRSSGDFILILDADFAPRADLLEELLPYFDYDHRTAIVQSPQFFRVLNQQNWIERGAGAVQELFYRAVQMSLQRKDGAICVGSCAVYRRAALEENDGMTLIEHSEDIHTGFDLRRLGWDLRYVPIALSTGLCPDTVNAFQNQQYRWCVGSLSLLGSRKFWKTKLRLGTRLCYLSGLFHYIHTALFTFAAPLIPITLLVGMPEVLQMKHMVLILPSLFYITVVFPMWHRCPYRLEAWAVQMMYGWAHVFAIWDTLGRRQMAWRPTGSTTARSNTIRRFWLGVALWGGGTAILWVGFAMWRMLTMNPPDFALILSSGLFYAMVVGRILVQPQAEAA